MVSKDDEWDLISPLVTPTDLERFHKVAIRVLQEPDPALDVEPERRFMANIIGEPRTYSLRLRESLADTVAFLGGYVDQVELSDGPPGRSMRIASSVPSPATSTPTGRAAHGSRSRTSCPCSPRRHRTLSHAVEAGLAGDDPLLRSLFLDRELAVSVGTSSPHIHLLWALETLCWSLDHLSAATAALAKLALIDPTSESRSRPRPAESLADVFRLYWPQTAAPLHRRLRVVDGLRRDLPSAAWALLRAILPSPLTIVGTSTHRPRWRRWAQDLPAEINYPEVIAGTTEIVARMVADAGEDGDRWAQLVSHLDSLPNDRESVLAGLQALDPASLGESGKTSVWRALVDLASMHRQSSDASWAMPADIVDRLQRIADRFAPTSLIELHTDLFGHHPRLTGIARNDHAGYDAALQTARQDAVRDVLDSGGVADLLALGREVTLPVAVGWAAADVRGDDLADDLLPSPRRRWLRRRRCPRLCQSTHRGRWPGLADAPARRAAETHGQYDSRPGCCSPSGSRAHVCSRSWQSSTPMCRLSSGSA